MFSIVEKNELSTVSNGCKVLLKCLMIYVEQINEHDNWDNFASHLNLIFAAISALCSAKPLSTSEFVSVVTLVKEWPTISASNFGIKIILIVKKRKIYIFIY